MIARFKRGKMKQSMRGLEFGVPSRPSRHKAPEANLYINPQGCDKEKDRSREERDERDVVHNYRHNLMHMQKRHGHSQQEIDVQNHWIPFFNANTTVSHLGQAKPVGPRLEESRRIILESRLQSPIACPQSAPVFLVSVEIIHIQRTINIRQSSFSNVLLNQATKSLEEFRVASCIRALDSASVHCRVI